MFTIYFIGRKICKMDYTIIKLKENSNVNGHTVFFYHLYFDNTKLESPKGALIEEHIINDIPTYKIYPFGFTPQNSGMLFCTVHGNNQSKKLTEQLNKLKQLTDIELENILHETP